MKLKKILMLFLTTLIFASSIQADAKVLEETQSIEEKSDDNILLARNLLLRFAQANIDLINEYKWVGDKLALLHDLSITSDKKFNLKKLFTAREWKKVLKVKEVEKALDDFIKDLLSQCDFLIRDSIDEESLTSQVYILDKNVSEFCASVGIGASESSEDANLNKLLSKVEGKIAKIEYLTKKLKDDPTLLGRIKKLFWGSNFSYNILPLTFSAALPTWIYFKNKSLAESSINTQGSGGGLIGWLFNKVIASTDEIANSKGSSNLIIKMAKNLIGKTKSNDEMVAEALQKERKEAANFILKKSASDWAGAIGGILVGAYKFLQADEYEDRKYEKKWDLKKRQIQVKKALEKKSHFSDVVGYGKAKETLRPVVEALVNPLKFKRFGINVPRGVLFSGLPGTGKTLFARAIAGEANVPCWVISASDLIGDRRYSSAQKIRNLFRQAEDSAPSIIFIDELDFIGSRKNKGESGSERYVALAHLLTKLNGFKPQNPYRPVLVVAATNCPEDLDEALIRSGRFDIRIQLDLPDGETRRELIEKDLKEKSDINQEEVSVDDLVDLTEGCSCADVLNAINCARLNASFKELGNPNLDDFRSAISEAKKPVVIPIA